MRKAVATERGKRDRDKRASQKVGGADEALFQALRSLRQSLATEAKVPPYVIFHDRTLSELSEKRPATMGALHGITGLGDRKVARYGDAILEVIGRFKSHPVLANRLSATINQTLAMHLEGKSADEIAAARNLEASTVLGHFAEAIEAGLVEASAVIKLDQSEIEEILAAFEKTGTLESGKLGPAHTELGGKYDYGTLKCLLAELG